MKRSRTWSTLKYTSDDSTRKTKTSASRSFSGWRTASAQ